MKIILVGILAFCATVSAANNYNGGCTGQNKHDCCAAIRDHGKNSWQADKTCEKYGCNRKSCFGYFDDDKYNDDDYKTKDDDDDDDYNNNNGGYNKK